jgi:hypothetical protein
MRPDVITFWHGPLDVLRLTCVAPRLQLVGFGRQCLGKSQAASAVEPELARNIKRKINRPIRRCSLSEPTVR